MVKIKNLGVSLVLTILVFAPVDAAAASVDINITSGDASCKNQVTIDQGTVTVTAGDTLTFKMPDNDKCREGLKVQGSFPGGEDSFTIKPGQSHTTQPIELDVSYYISPEKIPTDIVGNGSVVVTGTRSTPPTTEPIRPDSVPVSPVPDQNTIEIPEPTQRTDRSSGQQNESAATTERKRDKNTGAVIIASVSGLLLLAIAGFLWYYLKIRPKKLAVMPTQNEPIQPIETEVKEVEPRIIAPPIPLKSTKPTINPTSAPPLPVTQPQQHMPLPVIPLGQPVQQPQPIQSMPVAVNPTVASVGPTSAPTSSPSTTNSQTPLQ